MPGTFCTMQCTCNINETRSCSTYPNLISNMLFKLRYSGTKLRGHSKAVRGPVQLWSLDVYLEVSHADVTQTNMFGTFANQ